MGYEVETVDGDSTVIVGADAYAPDGPLTTFFSTADGRVDPWSVRVASFRTAEIRSVRRRDVLT